MINVKCGRYHGNVGLVGLVIPRFYSKRFFPGGGWIHIPRPGTDRAILSGARFKYRLSVRLNRMKPVHRLTVQTDPQFSQ